MANKDSSPDPSMEDILASIRRIIVDDDDKAAEARGQADASDEDDDVLELTEVAENEEVRPSSGAASRLSVLDIKGGTDRSPDEGGTTSPEADDDSDVVDLQQPADDAEETMANSPDTTSERLMSSQTASSAASALSSLARASDPDPLSGVPKGRPVEELVMDALKPMLSEWLNEHLPAIVERIVEREVRYLSRRPQDD